MLCQRCHEREATLELTRTVQETVKVEHVCASCARGTTGGLRDSLVRNLRTSQELTEEERRALEEAFDEILSQMPPDPEPPDSSKRE